MAFHFDMIARVPFDALLSMQAHEGEGPKVFLLPVLYTVSGKTKPL